MSSDPGAILPVLAFLFRAEPGIPCAKTTTTGLLWASMAMQMHNYWRYRSRLCVCP